MKSNEYWKIMELELQTLLTLKANMNKQNSDAEHRKDLSKQIHLIKVKLNQHRKVLQYREEHPIVKTNSLVYEMFGKKLRDLTTKEYRKYINFQHKRRRQELKRLKKEECVRRDDYDQTRNGTKTCRIS